MKELSTVNVVQISNGVVDEIKSWQDDEEGNRQARIYFHDTMIENIYNTIEEDVEVALENGYVESPSGLYSIYLVHSSIA